MTSSKALMYFCIFFVFGIFLSSIIKIPQIFIWGFLIFGISIIIIAFVLNKNNFIVLGFCILVLTLGIIRFQISEFNILNDKLSSFKDKPEKITLVGQIADEPDVRDNSQKLKVKIGNSLVLVTVGRYPEYKYLDAIKITGKLKTPGVFNDFNYKNYLLKDGIYSVMDFPKTELISQKHNYNIFTYFYEKILFFKEKLRESIFINFSPPQSLILEGIILGNNKTMTQDLRDKLNGTGLRYLTAISGVHVIIVSAILMSFLLALGFWRGQAFYFSIIFIWLYIVLTGFSASGIRAAIMGSIFLLAQKLGRQNTSSRTITLAGALMLLENPLLLFYDVGFQLSFLASFGIIYFKPLLDYIIKIVSKDRFKNLVNMISVTLTAQIFTIPIMVYNFGNISLIAPLTNLLVIPIFYPLMFFGFLASILGVFSNILGRILSIPCWFLLTYFLKIMDIFYQPWATKTIQNISWIWLAVYYLVLAILIWYLNKFKKPKFLGY